MIYDKQRIKLIKYGLKIAGTAGHNVYINSSFVHGKDL
jgi:hypothetical protein